ncbi:ATP-dependent DNA ligase [Chlorella sorokiniana]|uniref:ATP-dependent DNA ligase n=1 Tax=Chlorella sorokiniana TaxID=3076 RepID=A0A2P6TB85_CHLSO|nr:ATP-dependent DNA ligase [Chlorella sorokiniana]|eukprot:PRW05802.1 ATP-dependent DNA ligase [Chlorella sorokiniana]
MAAAGALPLLLPLLLPSAADAATALPHLPEFNGYWMALGLGGAGVVTTLLLTSRFLMSYFPSLEKNAKARPAGALYRLLTVADPVLDPITKGFFRQTQQGDLNYGAMALLALSSAVLTCVFGDGGLMVDRVPDLDTLQLLRYLSYFQHMLLLPMWVIVVFRFFMLI